MKSMNNQTATPSTSLTLIKNGYTIDVIARRKSLRIEKKVPKIGPNGPDWKLGYENQTIRIPVISIITTLLHQSGDSVVFRFTKMGSKESVTVLKTGQPATMVRNKLATGPELIPAAGSGKPQSTNINKAAAEIDRMTKMGWREARRLFNLDLIEAGVAGMEAAPSTDQRASV